MKTKVLQAEVVAGSKQGSPHNIFQTTLKGKDKVMQYLIAKWEHLQVHGKFEDQAMLDSVKEHGMETATVKELKKDAESANECASYLKAFASASAAASKATEDDKGKKDKTEKHKNTRKRRHRRRRLDTMQACCSPWELALYRAICGSLAV